MKREKEKKTSALSVRIEDGMRWTLELLARKHRAYSTGVLEQAIKHYAIESDVWQLARDTYSPDEDERVRLLNAASPDLLTFDEVASLRECP